MLLEYYLKYKKSTSVVNLPGFKAFVLLQYPEDYGVLIESMLLKDPDFKKILTLIEGDLTTQDLLGIVNTKAVDRTFKKYHDYDDKLIVETKEADKCYLPLKAESN